MSRIRGRENWSWGGLRAKWRGELKNVKTCRYETGTRGSEIGENKRRYEVRDRHTGR